MKWDMETERGNSILQPGYWLHGHESSLVFYLLFKCILNQEKLPLYPNKTKGGMDTMLYYFSRTSKLVTFLRPRMVLRRPIQGLEGAPCFGVLAALAEGRVWLPLLSHTSIPPSAGNLTPSSGLCRTHTHVACTHIDTHIHISINKK